MHKHDNHLQADLGYGHDSTASVKRRHIGPNPVEGQTRRCCSSGKLVPPIQHLQGQLGHKLRDHHGTPSASQKSIRSTESAKRNIRGREAKYSIRCVAKRWRALMGLIANEPRTARQPNKAGEAPQWRWGPEAWMLDCASATSYLGSITTRVSQS